MLKQITNATYLLIALHFIRLAVRRATVEQLSNNPDDAPRPPPEGCEYKVVLFYKSNGVLNAMEFYCEDTTKCYALYSAIRMKYPPLYTNDTLFTLSANDNLPDLFHSNCTFAARLPYLTQNAMNLTFREWLSMRAGIMQLPNANWDNYRDFKIC